VRILYYKQEIGRGLMTTELSTELGSRNLGGHVGVMIVGAMTQN